MRARLTQREISAVLDILNERLAGGAADLRDALGCSDEEADDIMGAAESAREKLLTRLKPEKESKP